MKKHRVKKHGVVEKIIPPPHPTMPEKAQISIDGCDHLYQEIRIDNTLETENGQKVKLKEEAPVDVVIEADPEATVPEKKNGDVRRDGAAEAKAGKVRTEN